ncbi:MAG: hypothetical protein QXQ29_01365 [Candidatus Bathyarchaeia archaeon]
MRYEHPMEWGPIRSYGVERTVLVILVWGLILEAITLLYFYTSAQTWRFEYQYTLLLFAITLIATIVFVARIARRIRSPIDIKDINSEYLYRSNTDIA